MKISIAISLLILVVAALLRWQGKDQLSAVEKTHQQLRTEAAALGIQFDSESLSDGVLVTKRTREDRGNKDAEARAAARKMVEFALEMESLKETGGEGREDMQERVAELMDLMLSMDASQLKVLIAEFRNNTEMEEESRNGMIAFAIMTLASDHPEAALSIFIESKDLLGEGMIGEHVLSGSLASWASTDPMGALEWVRENGKTNPDLITDDVKAGLVKGAASNDMALGFDLMAELKMEDASAALGEIARSIRTAEERTKFVGLLRDFSEEEANSHYVLHYLADGIAKDGFEKGSKWLDSNEWEGEELKRVSQNVATSAKSSEKGQWLGWMGENLSGERRDSAISSVMQNWTNSDYQAAGKWLAAEPNGPTKNASVVGYAEAVAKYDPQTAAQWAMTLPAGESRDETLRSIHRRWPTDTAEQKDQKAVFAKEHDIK